jgi:hypothetical protein
MKHGCAYATLFLLAACGGESDQARVAEKPVADVPDIAAPIVPPNEVADPAAPPSYEVAIAGAAAERNNAKQRCATQPESVRVQCEQEANASFSEQQSELDRLRGNTP